MPGYLSPPPLEHNFHRLTGRVVLVTGASSGIGEAAVRLFAMEGAQVLAVARRRDRVEALAAELGDSVAGCECDVTDEASVKAAVDFAVARFGKLDGAFNNAGAGGGRGKVHEASVADFDQMIATNVRGVFLCLKYEIAAMLKAGGGSIVNTSSIAGLAVSGGNTAYATSKWALAGLTRSAAMDYAKLNIRVNAVAPGATRTEMFDRGRPTEEDREQTAANFPMNYIAHADDMARYALWLLSDESRWTTGAVIPAEGGRAATAWSIS